MVKVNLEDENVEAFGIANAGKPILFELTPLVDGRKAKEKKKKNRYW